MISIFDKEQRACAIAHPPLRATVNNVTIDVTNNTNFNSLEEFLVACSFDDLQNADGNATPESTAHQERLKQSQQPPDVTETTIMNPYIPVETALVTLAMIYLASVMLLLAVSNAAIAMLEELGD